MSNSLLTSLRSLGRSRWRLLAVAVSAVWQGPIAAARGQDEPSPAQANSAASARELLTQAWNLAAAGDETRAADLADRAVKLAGGAPSARLERGRLLDRLRRFDGAIADFDAVLAGGGATFPVLRLRAGARFKSGDVAGAIADYEQAGRLDARRNRELWELGIAYYYAEKYQLGAEQFALYQTYYAADVENVVWRFLCQAAQFDADAARAEMLPLEGVDRRVPLMVVHEMFLGRAEPDDVLAAASAGEPNENVLREREFYGHLYVGLYYAAMGNQPAARRHLVAARERKISHFMWDVAGVHLLLWDRQEDKEHAASP